MPEILSNSLDALRRSLTYVADLLMPQDCFVCGHESGGAWVCEACSRQLPLQPAACPVCALPTSDGAACGHCLRAPPAFDATRAAFAYAFPVDRMIQALKYRYRLGVADFFAERLLALGAPPADALILPMPLHVQRLRERGFNQAVEIARPLARAWQLPLLLTGAERVKDSVAQASLPWDARQSNVRGVFHCDDSIRGRTVLVVDDVMTTGATLDELARTLKRHGAARVENLVVARTPPPAQSSAPSP